MVDDEELLELVEMEVELLSFYDYDGDNTPVVSGSIGALNGEAKWVDTVMSLMVLMNLSLSLSVIMKKTS